jgi:hypothetical protein
MIRVDEKVAVAVNGDGEPIGFKWRNANFLVSNRPMRWFARREWWSEASRAQRGIGSDIIEVEMWRLLASDLHQKSCQQYELIHSVGQDDWRLILVYP